MSFLRLLFCLVLVVPSLSWIGQVTTSVKGFSLFSEQKAEAAEQDSYTILVYMNGSDLETEGQAATTDLNEMLAANKSNDVNVVIQTGGTAQWHHSAGISNKVNQRWTINSRNKLQLVENVDNRSIGDYTNLRDFVQWGVENYPAEKFVLLFWNHGGGAVGGFGVDELHPEDSGLTLDEIQLALGEAYEHTESMFEMIGFDACLMATVETATILAPYANYFVASEQIEPGHGWDYTPVLRKLSANPYMTGKELGKTIADSYLAHSGGADMITLSVTDLTKVDTLNSYISKFPTVLNPYIEKEDNFNMMMRARANAQEYEGTGMVDLGDYINQVKSTATTLSPAVEQLLHNIQVAINEAVVYKVASPTYKRAQGLSIYMPFGEQINGVDEYYNVASLEEYEQYVDGYVAKLRAMDEGINFVSDISEETEEIPSEDPNSGDEFDQQQIFSVQVAEEDIDRVAELYSVLAMYEEPGSSNLIYLGYDADVSFDMETGMITDNFTGNWVLLDDQFVSMYLEEETEDYLKYSIPVKLNGEEVNIIVLFDFSQGNDEAYAEIIGATGLVDENNMADKNLIDIVSGDIITPLYETYNIETGEAGTLEGEPFEVTDELVLMEAELPPGEYLYGFYALDFAGNESFSEYVNLQIDEGEEIDDGIEKSLGSNSEY